MLLQDILRNKGSQVLSIEPSATLDDVVQKLVRHNCGSLVVCQSQPDDQQGPMVGIVTERDILRACAARRGTLDSVTVSEVMTTNVITGAPQDPVEDAMGLMTRNRVRHLPVLDDDKLVGMISIGDVVKAQHDQFAVENHHLKAYIQG
jgi:CBS domain-containing protein